MIREVIVVEGKDDTVAIQRAVEADTIETGGSAVSEMTIRRIALAQERRGVIIFTDPDHAGERIRKMIAERVPGCKHAFLARHEAIAKETSAWRTHRRRRFARRWAKSGPRCRRPKRSWSGRIWWKRV